MNATQRNIFIAALILVAAGIVFGFVQAAVARHHTMPAQNFRTQWTAATQGARADQVSYRNTRVIDAHTHIIKLASVLLLLGFAYPIIAIGERAKRRLAVIFMVGSCVFPLGVLAEIYVKGRFAQAVAAFGALLIIISFSAVLWGLLRSTARSPLTR